MSRRVSSSLCVALLLGTLAAAQDAEPKSAEDAGPKGPPPLLAYVKDVNLKDKVLTYSHYTTVFEPRVREERVKQDGMDVTRTVAYQVPVLRRAESACRIDAVSATLGGDKAITTDEEWAALKGQMIVVSRGELDPAYLKLFARRTVLITLPSGENPEVPATPPPPAKKKKKTKAA